jgi:cation transport ATPase
MQEKIFPAEQLLKTTHYTYFEPKNAKFVAEWERDYEVSLIEKNDIVRLKKGVKLLFDGVIINGEIK